jgi:hypothetical protein
MSLTSSPYYYQACNGRAANLLAPRCQILGPGSFDADEAVRLAEEQGWVESGKYAYCPAHQDQAAPADAAPEKPATAARRRGKLAAVEAADAQQDRVQEQQHG